MLDSESVLIPADNIARVVDFECFCLHRAGKIKLHECAISPPDKAMLDIPKTATTTTTTTEPNYAAIKQRQQATWAAGDYAMIGTTLQITGETLCEAVDVAAGEQVLDIAAGNGNAALAAARRGCGFCRARRVRFVRRQSGNRARSCSPLH